MSGLKFERIQRNARTELTGLEIEHVGSPCAVNQLDGIKFEMLKIVQTIRLGNLDVEAAAANLAVALSNRSLVDDIVGRCGFVAVGTADLLGPSELYVIHNA